MDNGVSLIKEIFRVIIKAVIPNKKEKREKNNQQSHKILCPK